MSVFWVHQGAHVTGDGLPPHAAQLRALRLSGRATAVEGFGPAAAAAALERHGAQLRVAGLGGGSGGELGPGQMRVCCGALLCCREWLLFCPQLASQVSFCAKDSVAVKR